MFILVRVIISTVSLAFFGITSAPAQNELDSIWRDLPTQASTQARSRAKRPEHFISKGINRAALNKALSRVPKENRKNAKQRGEVISLPMPDGKLQYFEIFETSVMAPELAAKFPEIKTYVGRSLEDATASVRIDVSPQGFHAQMLSSEGAVYIDPLNQFDQDNAISYYKSDYTDSSDAFECLVDSEDAFTSSAKSATTTAARSGAQLRTYKMACATTAEYTTYHGGTVPLGLAAVVTAINRVSGIYEVELSIRLELVANNDLLIYTNASTDPYTNDDSNARLAENQTNIDTVIGDANYDIGHVFSTDGGGAAYLGIVGISGSKALGETGLANPTGDVFYIDLVAHEIGHQFGGSHTFNGDSSGCSGGNRNGPTAYEPGSGNTIQAYAGLCGDDNIQSRTDTYFHSISFDEIIAHVDISVPNEGVRTFTGNSVPVVDAGDDYTIPAQTPFILTASGMDADGNDSLTYNWEQRDIGPQQDVNAGDNGLSPLFRSWTPDAAPTRTCPRLSDLLNNTTVVGETLPTTTRTMNFRATVRDNELGGGGVNTDDMVITVINTGSPFAVTSPNTAVDWPAQSNQTVTWDPAGTTGNGINCNAVSIYLSTDGGQTYPTLIAAGTPNDGSHAITVPNTQSTQARIRVQGDDNIFFDISDTNFTISELTFGFTLEITPNNDSICAPADGVYTLNVISVNGFNNPVTLSASNSPSGTSASFSMNPVLPGNSTTLTISDTEASTAGLYLIEVDGAYSVYSDHVAAALELSSDAPATVTLLTPTQASVGTSITETFTWSALSESGSYLLEIDNDPAFGSIDYSHATAATSHTLTTALLLDTPYYWRVTSINNCSQSTSGYHYFTTESTPSSICNAPGTAIPDNNATGITDQIVTTANGTLTDLDVSVNIIHTWIGDLSVNLRHVDTNTSVDLILKPGVIGSGNGSFEENIIVILDDEAGLTVEDNAPYITGDPYSPNNPLSTFDGESLSGTWELTVTDTTGGDVGTLVDWCLLPSLSGSDTTYSTLTIADTSFDETVGTAVITANLSAPFSSAVNFNSSTQDGSAESGSDYTTTSGPSTISPSNTTVNIQVPILSDDLVESDEVFTIQLSNSINVIIPDNLVTITINDSSTPFMVWLDGFGLSLAEANSDNDFDGINALLEYGFNLDPSVSSQIIYDPDATVGPEGPVGLPKIKLTDQGENSKLQIIFPRRTASSAPTLNYGGYFSDNLSSWLEQTTITTEPINANWEKVTIDDTVTIQTAPQSKRFGQVQLESN